MRKEKKAVVSNGGRREEKRGEEQKIFTRCKLYGPTRMLDLHLRYCACKPSRLSGFYRWSLGVVRLVPVNGGKPH